MKAAIFACVLLLGTQGASGAERPPITSVSHLAVYAGDAAKTERFYVHDLGAVKRSDPTTWRRWMDTFCVRVTGSRTTHRPPLT